MMPRPTRRWISLSSLIAAPTMFLTTPPCTNAAVLELRISVDANPIVTFLDNNAPDNNPAIGILGISAININGLQFFGNVSMSDSLGGPPGQLTSQLSTQSLNIQNPTVASRTVSVAASDAGFSIPASPLTLTGSASGTFSPIPGGAVTDVVGATARARSWADNTNTKFGTQFPVQDFAVPPASVGQPLLSYADTDGAGGFTFTTAYAMTVQLDLTLPAGVQLNGHANAILAAIPEPGALGVAAISLWSLVVRPPRRRGALDFARGFTG